MILLITELSSNSKRFILLHNTDDYHIHEAALNLFFSFKEKVNANADLVVNVQNKHYSIKENNNTIFAIEAVPEANYMYKGWI